MVHSHHCRDAAIQRCKKVGTPGLGSRMNTYLITCTGIAGFMDRWHTEVPSSGVAVYIGSLQLAQFENAGASALHIHTLPFGFDSGDVTGIGV